MSSTATGHVTPAAHYAPPADLAKWQRLGLVGALVGGVGCVAGVFRRARVPAFSGQPVTVSNSFNIK